MSYKFSPITRMVTGSEAIAKTDPKPGISVDPNGNGKLDPLDAIRWIESNVWGALVTLGFLGFFLYKPVSSYMKAQKELVEKLTATTSSNHEAIVAMRHTQDKVVDSLVRMEHRQDKVEDTLDAMQAGLPYIIHRQKLQVRYLKDIAGKIELPLPVHEVDSEDE